MTDAPTATGKAELISKVCAAVFAACVASASLSPAMAQVADPSKVAKTAAKPAGAATGAAAPATGQGSGEGGLKSRVESLEEQLVDMQVVVGTLESLAKSGGGAAVVARTPVTGGADSARIDGLETQVRALSAQVQQLSDQVRSMGGVPRRSDTGVSLPQTATAAPPPPAASTFGSTSVSSGGGDAIGGLIEGSPLPPVPSASGEVATPDGGPGAGVAPGVTTAALPPSSDGASPKQLYETAYGYMLQRDYGAAETSFDDFLKRFPNDSLAGNAQYWLGESYFVRGQYKAAAGAFLKGYQTYAQSAKAPDSLLKLAMSLDRLGQKDAACSSYSELGTKFPTAPQSVKARAQSERQRVGCP
jgi:tol-pal system protein YbgF